MKMNIAIGNDHAGYALKVKLMEMLKDEYKVPGIRAAACQSYFAAKYCRLHNDAQIICLGERITGPGEACEMVQAFLGGELEGGRHAGRIEKIHAIEKKHFK